MALWARFEFIYNPKRGSWLNIAEIEINVMLGQCLHRRIDSIETRPLPGRAAATTFRPNQLAVHNQNAQVKLKRLYSTTHS